MNLITYSRVMLFWLCTTDSTMSATLLLLAAVSIIIAPAAEGYLYPKDSPSRLVKELNGVWHFKIDDSRSRNAGFEEKWFSKPLSGNVTMMPVPSSFNDITQDPAIRDFTGWAWYDRNFWIPEQWLDGKTRVVLRFESAHYYTIVWVNGEQVMEHEGGHLPFEADITAQLVAGKPNRVTAAVNNTLTPHTLPPGEIKYHGPPDYPEGYFEQTIQFDFYNYAGIQRAVKLYTTPTTYISDITVVTKIGDDGSASVQYAVDVNSNKSSNNLTCSINLYGAEPVNKQSVKSGVATGSLLVKSPDLWWPWTMSDNPGVLNPLNVQCTDEDSGVSDYYRLSVGLREVKVTQTQFLINNKPFYLNGVDKHEDWDTIGKGIDYALIMKDINLFKWLGVAAFRTSHYPYAEELLDLCDKAGIAVILESPAVGLHNPDNFDPEVLKHHIDVMGEMYSRDKNRPSVIMWSVANEPASDLSVAGPYFKAVADATHALDSTRPITFACNKNYKDDLGTQYMDVIMLNQYFSWYSDTGHPELVARQMTNKLVDWHTKHNKPIMVSEYGAGALPGDHKLPGFAWSEEYQAEVLASYWPVFDEYRKKFFIGELIWVFADFKTDQGTNRPDGNHKGLFTRQRQPKLAANLVRQRYMALAEGRDYHPDYIFPK